MNYYILLNDGTVRTFNNVQSIDSSSKDTVTLNTASEQIEISVNDVILYGDEEYWIKILELFQTIDRLTNKMVKSKLQKAMSFGYLVGLFTM